MDHAEQLVAETGARLHAPDIHLVRAELARLRNDDELHTADLREAHRLFTEMDATGHAKRVARELAW